MNPNHEQHRPEIEHHAHPPHEGPHIPESTLPDDMDIDVSEIDPGDGGGLFDFLRDIFG